MDEHTMWTTFWIGLAAVVISIVIGVTVTNLNWQGYQADIVTSCVSAGSEWRHVPNTDYEYECVLPA